MYRHTFSSVLVAALSIACLTSSCRPGAWNKGLAASFSRTLVPFETVTGETPVAQQITGLRVDARVGEVEVIGDSPDRVRIEAKVLLDKNRQLSEPAAGDFARHVRVETIGDTLRISDAHSHQADERDWSVAFVVHAPPQLTLEVATGVGNVRVDKMAGAIDSSTGTGNVTVSGASAALLEATSGVGNVEARFDAIEGRVHVSSGTGDVTLHISQRAPSGPVQAKTGVGDVSLRLPAGVSGSFNLSTGVGSIQVSGHAGISVTRQVTSASGSGSIGQGGTQYLVSTGVGNISLH